MKPVSLGMDDIVIERGTVEGDKHELYRPLNKKMSSELGCDGNTASLKS